jgi:hypothetical protein
MMGCDVGMSFVYCEWLWIAAFFKRPPGGGCCAQDCVVIMYYEELLHSQLMVCQIHAAYVIGYGCGT